MIFQKRKITFFRFLYNIFKTFEKSYYYLYGGLKNKLANDLKEYGKGYSYDNLNYMSKFALNFKYDEIFEQPARLIPWFTIVVIIPKSKTHEEMLYYINETHKNGCYRN